MYDSGKVIFGIIIFIIVFTLPIWMNLAGGLATVKPLPELPKDSKACVESKEYMKAFHMDMLNQWRDKVVRQDIRYMNFNGQKVEMSLSKTCMKCHPDKAHFCDQCHNYLGVKPYCWDCHVEPGKANPKEVAHEIR